MTESKFSRVVNSGWTLFIAVLFIGPFALPLLWRNPRFSKAFKWIWTFIIVAITIFCFWALKFSATKLSEAMAAEPCRFERHRPAYPPGAKTLRVYSSASKMEKFSDSKPFFEYLKSINGKECDVDWLAAKKEIEEWLSTGWISSESPFGPELDALVAQQKNGVQAPPSTAPQLVKTSSTSASSAPACANQLAELRSRISSLKSKVYDSPKTRAAEIDSILRSLE